MADHSRLGRGLAALIGDVGEGPAAASNESSRKPRRAPIESLRPNPRNPRRAFTEAELEELVASIRERGIIQPIVVRNVGGQNDSYEIIAGERRWRAAQRAGLHDVPIAIVEATDAQSLEFAIIENVQRADLNPIEEAAGYVMLMEQFNHSQEQVAQIVGKSRPHVANMVRLMKLSEPVKAMVRAGKISAGHARLLVGQPNAEEIAHEIAALGLSVRQVEQMMREDGAAQAREVRREARGPIIPSGKDADTRALEKRLSDVLGLVVSVDHNASGGGTLHIKYRDLDQLDEVLRKLGG
ncbi:MAG TPA: ParB/RepB/Spo0J family partition protein [Pseudolabrys sp.]|jgi:ParB family chromosome partitioning protein|nr:ParB/RepB/Spo0J family partition protein [Pseudolabrys sp.]